MKISDNGLILVLLAVLAGYVLLDMKTKKQETMAARRGRGGSYVSHNTYPILNHPIYGWYANKPTSGGSKGSMRGR